MDRNTLLKIIVGLVVLVILYIVFKEPINNFFKEPKAVPLRPTTMSDCGYPDRPRGWYDVRNRGYRNDFCRHVGAHPGVWACVIQGDVDANGAQLSHTEIYNYPYNPNTPYDEYKKTLIGGNCQ